MNQKEILENLISKEKEQQKQYIEQTTILENEIGEIKNNISLLNKDIERLETQINGAEKYNESANENNDINTKDILGTEIKFLKIQIQQLKDIIKQDKIFMEDLNERNRILEQEKKNLMAELEDTIIQSRKDEKKDTINSEYIENNINDIHELLNEKEIKEKNMNDEIYNLKLILEKNKLEYNEIINTKNIELKKRSN